MRLLIIIGMLAAHCGMLPLGAINHMEVGACFKARDSHLILDVLTRGKSDLRTFRIIPAPRGREGMLPMRGGCPEASADVPMAGGEEKSSNWEKALRGVPIEDFPRVIAGFNG
jgi:hypothetical protein